jgi:hypothetical protein
MYIFPYVKYNGTAVYHLSLYRKERTNLRGDSRGRENMELEYSFYSQDSGLAEKAIIAKGGNGYLLTYQFP